MICRECTTQVPDESTFCLNCGDRLVPRVPKQESEILPPPVQSQSPWAKVAVMTVLTIAMLAAFYFYRQAQNAIRANSGAAQITGATAPAPSWQNASTTPENKVFTIEPQRFVAEGFTVPQEWRNVRLYCKFRAQGGSGNDIKAYVTNAEGLENLKNNHAFKTWYSSNQVTVGTIDIQLDPGQYYLVFSNTFSLVSSKVVNAEIQIHYEYFK